MPPYRAGICSCTAAPYRFVELLCRKNLLLVFCKETQQREFGPGKACVGIIEICMAVRKIQPQAADGDLTGGLKFFFYFFFHSFLAFQKHLDHGQKFIEIIRFGEIIVASLLKSFYPIPDITFSGEKKNRIHGFFAEAAADIQTVSVRKHNIQDQKIRQIFINLMISLSGCLCGADIITAAPQHPAVCIQDLFFILDHEDVWFVFSHLRFLLRKGKEHAGTFAFFTFYPYFTAMGSDDLMTDIEAYAVPPVILISGNITLECVFSHFF